MDLIGGIEKRAIVLVPHDPAWADRFDRLAGAIRAALGPLALRVDHIGSTAAPGLLAKPIIDVLLIVPDSADEASYHDVLIATGYELRVREPAFHEHRMYRTRGRDVHLHVFSAECPEIERHVRFRDLLRGDAAARQRYAEVKRQLAAREWPDMNAYAQAKSGVIEEILAGG